MSGRRKRGGASRGRRVLVAAGLLVVLAGVGVVALWSKGIVEAPVAVRELLDIKQKEVKIAVVVTRGPREDEFIDGVNLAIDGLNQAGGIDGLPVVAKLFYEDTYSQTSNLQKVVDSSLGVAAKVSKEKDLLAVIGHMSSATALPASGVYNKQGVLFLATHATDSSLTNHGFGYVFGLQPSNTDSAAMIAHYAIDQGMKRFVVLHDDTDYGKQTTNLFQSWVTRAGGKVLFRSSLSGYNSSVDRLMTFILDNTVFKPADIDAFFLISSSTAQTAKFIRRARELGLQQPILGTDGMFSKHIVDYVGPKKMNGVTGVSLYDEHSTSAKAVVFKAKFRNRYHADPDQMAAVGYDAVNLLAFAVKHTYTLDAGPLADWLHVMRYGERFIGATGPLVFDAKGLVTDTDAYIVRHDGVTFHTVASYHKPLKWDNIGLSNQVDDDAAMYGSMLRSIK